MTKKDSAPALAIDTIARKQEDAKDEDGGD
jgi:hypothetical protein